MDWGEDSLPKKQKGITDVLSAELHLSVRFVHFAEVQHSPELLMLDSASVMGLYFRFSLLDRWK